MNLKKSTIIALAIAVPAFAHADSIVGKVQGIYREAAPSVYLQGKSSATARRWAEVELRGSEHIMATLSADTVVEVGDLVQVAMREPGVVATAGFSVAPLSRPTRVARIEAKHDTLRALEFGQPPVAATPVFLR